MTALAQLATLRLNVKRGMIALIDKTHQIILAQATQTFSLVHSNRHAPGDNIWLGNVNLPRAECMGDHVFGSQWFGKDSDGKKHTLSALVVNDVENDARFSNREYVLSTPGVKFYAGVPVITKNGHEIGVYSVTDIKAHPEGLTLDQVQFLQDCAQIVADHLERLKITADRQRDEAFVRGLTSFVDGLSAYKHDLNSTVEDMRQAHENPAQTGTELDPTHSPAQATDPQPDHFAHQEPPSSKVDEFHNHSPNLRSYDDGDVFADKRAAESIEVPGPGEDDIDKNRDNIIQIFKRAASTIQQAVGMTGCVFVDATPGLTSTNVNLLLPELNIRVPRHESYDSETETDESTSEMGPETSSSVSNDHFDPPRPGSDSDKEMDAEVLGASIEGLSALLLPAQFMQRKHLRKCLRRFPLGKVFYMGRMRASDTDLGPLDEFRSTTRKSRHRPLSTDSANVRALPRNLLDRIPNAKWLVFLPLFNYAQSQWCSAGFMWSDNENVGDLEAAMPYLQTFGACIMSEVTSMEALNTNIAKSTFIASISHDLRSPLHGVLGSLELLEPSLTTAYQVSLAATISTCGKTLLDTIDHLLDFAKINNLNKTESNKRDQDDPTQNDANAGIGLVDTTTFDVSLLLEEVVEAVFAGQTFRKTQLRNGDPVDETIYDIQQIGADHSMTTDESIYAGSAKFSGKVFVIISVSNSEDSYFVSGQSGALRRIILNIVGNAIKYCQVGAIEITLNMERKSDTQVEVIIDVNDTGIGMSKDFQANHLYKAFSQENAFSPGAGLGLSITAQIVRNLGGKIGIRSARDSGTHVTVTLPMLRATDSSIEDDGLLKAARSLAAGKGACLLNPQVAKSEIDHGRMPKLTASLAQACESWFGMIASQSRKIADHDKADIYIYCEPPPIEYLLQHNAERERSGSQGRNTALLIICTNAFEAAALRAAGVTHLNALGHIIEVISQPVGIRKLAKVLVMSLERLRENEKADDTPIYRIESRRAFMNGEAQDRAEQVGWNGTNTVYDNNVREYRPSIDTIRWKSALPALTVLPDRTLQSAQDIQAANNTVITPHETLNPIAKSHSNSSQSVDPPYVLLVEDNAINLKLLATFMKKIGTPFADATNGKEAFEIVKSSHRPFDFILMDLQMPIMDGLESTRCIREYEEQTKTTHRCTIIAITGVGSESTRKEAISLGMDFFLTKPVRFKALQQILDQKHHEPTD